MGRARAQRRRVAAGGNRQLGLQQSQHRIIEPPLGQPARSQRLRQAAGKHHLKGHFQVLAGQNGRHAIVNAKDEIADHKTLESPAPLQNRIQQFGMFAAPGAIDPVVGAHHRSGAGLDAITKVGQVELVQHPLIHLHIHQEAAAVDRIEGEVFDASDGVALQAADAGGPHGTHMHRIFAVGLLGPAPAGMAQQVDADRRHPVGPKRTGLQGDRLTDALLQLRIPAGAPGDRHRKAGGASLEHHTPRPIDKLQSRQPQAGQLARRPGVAMGGIPQGDVGHPRPEGRVAIKQGQLFCIAELGQQHQGPGRDGGRDVSHTCNVRSIQPGPKAWPPPLTRPSSWRRNCPNRARPGLKGCE